MSESQDRSRREQRYVAYYRVSSSQQAKFGMSSEAQRRDIRRYIETHPGRIIAEFEDTVSGRRKNRPQLQEALRLCRIYRAVLLIARMDRLARNMAFTAALAQSGQEFIAVDFPHANRFTVHILAALAEYESNLISERIKAAVVVARARTDGRWPKNGFPHGIPPRENLDAARRASIARLDARRRDLAPLVWPMFVEGKHYGEIATQLNQQGIPTVQDKKWTGISVRLLLCNTRSEFGASPEALHAFELGPHAYRRQLRLREMGPLIQQLRAQGLPNDQIVKELNSRPRTTTWDKPIKSSMLLKLVKEIEHLPQRARLVSAKVIRAVNLKAKYAPLIWQLAKRGMSATAIASEMVQRDIRPRQAPWSRQIVENILFDTRQEPYACDLRTRKRSAYQARLDRRARELAPLVSRLVAEGQSYCEIAATLKRRRIVSPTRRPWSYARVIYLISKLKRNGELSVRAIRARESGTQKLRALARAKAFARPISIFRTRGLKFAEIAEKLNQRRSDGSTFAPWTKASVRKYYQMVANAGSQDSAYRTAPG